jgi:hypothetical protein
MAKGGTWAGAIEQLDKLRFVPMYVRSTGRMPEGLLALQNKGALPWPNPTTPDELIEILATITAKRRSKATVVFVIARKWCVDGYSNKSLTSIHCFSAWSFC